MRTPLFFVFGVSPAAPGWGRVGAAPTGAGDVFAAALLIHLQERDDPLAAAHFAACVAAASVEGQGASTIPPRELVQARMGQG